VPPVLPCRGLRLRDSSCDGHTTFCDADTAGSRRRCPTDRTAPLHGRAWRSSQCGRVRHLDTGTAAPNRQRRPPAGTIGPLCWLPTGCTNDTTGENATPPPFAAPFRHGLAACGDGHAGGFGCTNDTTGGRPTPLPFAIRFCDPVSAPSNGLRWWSSRLWFGCTNDTTGRRLTPPVRNRFLQPCFEPRPTVRDDGHNSEFGCTNDTTGRSPTPPSARPFFPPPSDSLRCRRGDIPTGRFADRTGHRPSRLSHDTLSPSSSRRCASPSWWRTKNVCAARCPLRREVRAVPIGDQALRVSSTVALTHLPTATCS